MDSAFKSEKYAQVAILRAKLNILVMQIMVQVLGGYRGTASKAGALASSCP